MDDLRPYKILLLLAPRRSHWSSSPLSHSVAAFALVLATQTNPFQVHSSSHDKPRVAYQCLFRLETLDLHIVKAVVLEIPRFTEQVGLLSNALKPVQPTYVP
jgi:hypothetical protein